MLSLPLPTKKEKITILRCSRPAVNPRKTVEIHGKVFFVTFMGAFIRDIFVILLAPHHHHSFSVATTHSSFS